MEINQKNVTTELISALIKKRPQDSHKGTFGTLRLFCGSKNMPGAAYFAAIGALRCGVGLLCISIGKNGGNYLKKILQTRLPEPIFDKFDVNGRETAIVVGCGLSRNAKIVKKLLKQQKPLVIDADAINFLSCHKKLLLNKKCETVLTPHPLEMSRISGKSLDEILSNRVDFARNMSILYDSTVVLKGKNTIISSPSGEIFINATGNSGLAKGGSGDVLAGMIGAFLAQGYNPTDAAVISVWLHGKAADILAEKISQHGLLPSEIPKTAAKILKTFE